MIRCLCGGEICVRHGFMLQHKYLQSFFIFSCRLFVNNFYTTQTQQRRERKIYIKSEKMDLEMTTEYYLNSSVLYSTQLASMELSSTTEVSLSDSINKTFHNIITTKDIVSCIYVHVSSIISSVDIFFLKVF